ncbi:MAG: thiamine pyrophosphate-dependent enzyme [Thermoplasmata archaeon]
MNAGDGLLPLPYDLEKARSVLGPDAPTIALSAYRWMILGRTLDARMQGLQRQGRVGFYGAATGHEVVNVALGLATGPHDWIVPGLREQLTALVRGHPLATYAQHLFATDLDPARSRQMPCHPSARDVHYVSMSSVVGTQITHAVGIAAGLRARKDPGVALGFFGDGATSANDFHAGLNFAAVYQLPVVFGCANNGWAISVPVEHQTRSATLAGKGAAYGVPGERIDGTDFFESYATLRDAIARARSGQGPTLIEFLLYRMTPHSSSDDPTRYQPREWAARAAAHDPVLRLEQWLRKYGFLEPDLEGEIRDEADRQVRDAVAGAEAAPPPRPESLTEDVFVDSPPCLPERGE